MNYKDINLWPNENTVTAYSYALPQTSFTMQHHRINCFDLFSSIWCSLVQTGCPMLRFYLVPMMLKTVSVEYPAYLNVFWIYTGVQLTSLPLYWVTELYTYLGWIRPPIPSSPTFNWKASFQLDHGTKCYVRCLLSTSRNGYSTTSLGRLFHSLTILSVKKFFVNPPALSQSSP